MVEKPCEKKNKTKCSNKRKTTKSAFKAIDKPFNKCFFNCNKKINVLHPLLTNDSRYVVCANENEVFLFQAKTGLIFGIFNEHKYHVCNIYIHEKDPSQIISCSSHEIIFWDYVDRTVMQRFEWNQVAHGVYINSLCDTEHVYFTLSQDEKEENSLCKYNLNKGKIIKKFGIIAATKNPLAFHRSGKYIAYITNVKLKIYIPETDTTKNLNAFDISKKTKSKLSSVAFHPAMYTIATGTKDGRIFLWYNWRKGDSVAVKLHWHHTPVDDILFTNDGNYLLSGALETVLVIWQLETQEKSFLPRLGGAIEHLFQSSDGTTIGVSLSTNMIKLISAIDNNHSKSIKFLTEAKNVPAGFSYHSKTNCIVLNGNPEGHIQFYQPLQDSVKITLDIIGENVITIAPNKRLNSTTVTKIAFSDDGVWMATIDQQDTKLLGVERKLKFWKFTGSKDFVLNSVVDPPHSEDINSLAFRPMESSEYSVVSTSNRGEIKLWYLTQGEGDIPESWQLVHCNASFCGKFSEHNFSKSAQFSPDGSMLAVLFDKVTLWDPDTLSHETTLMWISPTLNKGKERIKSFCIGHNESSHYVIGCSEEYLVVWNLNTCFIEWQMKAKVIQLASDPYSKYFAAFIQFGEDRMHLYLFDPSTQKPVAAQPNVRMTHPIVKDVIFTQPQVATENTNIWSQIGRLFYMTSKTGKLDICTLKIEDETCEKETSVAENIEEDNVSSFKDIFSSDVRTGRKRVEYSEELPLGEPCEVAVRKMMTTPSHVLPSVNNICQGFYHSLLLESKKIRNNEADTGDDVQNDAKGVDNYEMEAENSDNDGDDDDDDDDNDVMRHATRSGNVVTLDRESPQKDWDEISSIKIRSPQLDFLLKGKYSLS